jgi:outer membrane protein assembly factor BamB
VIVQFDQGDSAKESRSKLLAFDGITGKIVWETPRPVPNCWSSPIVVRHGDRDLLVASGDPWVIAYQPADGKEIWRVKCLKQDIGPSPTYAGGMVFAVNQFPQLTAIRPDGQGDITATNIAWSGEDGLPDTCSPLATDEFVMLLGDGVLTGYDTKSGKKLWEKDVDGAFKASPTSVGKLVYVFNDEGKALVVEPSRSGCKDVGTGELGENCSASPAFHNGRMYVRGEKHLFCIGNP